MAGTNRRSPPPAVLRALDRRARRTRRFLVFYAAATLIWLFRALTDGWWLAWVFTAMFSALAAAVLVKLVRQRDRGGASAEAPPPSNRYAG